MKYLNKVDILNNSTSTCVFVRKIDLEIDVEYRTSFFNKWFSKIFENENVDDLYEVLYFNLDFQKNEFKYGRVVRKNLLARKWSFIDIPLADGIVKFEDNSLSFETYKYNYCCKYFNSVLLNMQLKRTNKETSHTVDLIYFMLIG